MGLHASEGFGQFLQTQVELVRSPNVLDAALRKSGVYALSIVRSAEDPEAELQRLLQVGIVPGTYLIKVSITSPTPAEASAIIKAVVEAYLRTADEWADGMSGKQLKSLESYQDELQRQVLEKQNEWLALASKGNIELVNDEGSGQSSGLPRPSNERITLDEYKRVREQLFQVSLELVENEALLNARRAELKLDASKSDPALRLQRRVREAFKADPEVAQVYQQIEKLQRRHEEITRLARLGSDPAIAHAERQLRALVARHRQLWDAKYEELVARFQEETDPSDPASGPRELAERVEMLKIRRANFEKILSQLKLTNTQEGTDAVKVALVREDLSSLKGMVEAVGRRIEQLKFEARGEARISKIDETRPGGIFVGDNRKKVLGHDACRRDERSGGLLRAAGGQGRPGRGRGRVVAPGSGGRLRGAVAARPPTDIRLAIPAQPREPAAGIPGEPRPLAGLALVWAGGGVRVGPLPADHQRHRR